jgi:hypothetical protein
MKIRWRPSAALVIAAVWTIYGVATLHGHGVTSDAPALFYAGDRTLFWLTHPRTENALDLMGPEPEGFHVEFQRHPNADDVVHYPVFPGLVAAVASSIFHDAFGWLDVIDGHHLGLVLMQAIALAIFCRWAVRLLGRTAGVASAVVLALYPTAVGHAFNNPKDWPCTMFAGIAVLAVGVGIVSNRGKPLVAAGLYFGLALACKLNAVIPMAAVVAAVPIGWFLLYWRRRRISRSLAVGALAMPYIAALTFIASWPWLWQARGVVKFWQRLNDYMHFMLSYGVRPRPGWTAYPFKAVFFMTPPLVFACAVAGAAMYWRAGRERAFTIALLLVTMAVPLLRIAAPGSNFYDANRHFIEYIPPLAALAGLGVAAIARAVPLVVGRLRWRFQLPRWSGWAAAGVAIAVAAWPIVQYRPYESVYYNVFAGGLGGAQQSGLFRMARPPDPRTDGTEGDYWWSSTRAGFEAARAADPEAPIAFCGGAAELLSYAQRKTFKVAEPTNRAALVFVCPREIFCPWTMVRDMESKRPILKRVERGGGLVWELLGPETGASFTPRSPENAYTRADDRKP